MQQHGGECRDGQRCGLIASRSHIHTFTHTVLSLLALLIFTPDVAAVMYLAIKHPSLSAARIEKTIRHAN
jgi:hypothetical protein